MQRIKNIINFILKINIYTFPILLAIGPFAINSFAVIFSIYGIVKFVNFIKKNFLSKKFFFLIFSFIILIFPFNSIDFENSFLKYLSYYRFILMFLGLIIFFYNEKLNKKFFLYLYKLYCFYIIFISIDVIIELYRGYNILGYSTEYSGRVASFTGDELIIGFIFCFLSIFSLLFIYKKTSHLYFLLFIGIIFSISFLIGERSNFIKFAVIIIIFFTIILTKLEKVNKKKLLILITIITIFLSTFYNLTINSQQGKKFYDISNLDYFFNSKHAPHYYTAYKIFLNYPVFGIGINNFYQESGKKEYENSKFFYTNDRVANHPHQVYLEILSEVGLFGSIYFFFIIFFPIFISIKNFLKKQNYMIIPHFLLHIFFVIPIMPSGSIFGTIYGIPFWFNLAFLIYLNKKIQKF